MSYASSQHWNQYYDELCQSGQDLDWGTQWTGAFIEPLRQVDSRRILDLGCGTGNEVLGLTQEGFEVTGVDYSRAGIHQAITKARSKATFIVADMAQSLPFQVGRFDAVMSNVAAHMFSDEITRRIFGEVKRILRPEGLFLFHLNAVEDRPFRARKKPEVRKLEENYIMEEDGQTMHFFSEEYLRELLTGWGEVKLELVEIPEDREKEYPPKWIWRGIVYCL